MTLSRVISVFISIFGLVLSSSPAFAKSKICKKGESAIKLESSGFTYSAAKPTKADQKKLWVSAYSSWKSDTNTLKQHCQNHENGMFYSGKARFRPIAYQADMRTWQMEVFSGNYCCAKLNQQEGEEQALLYQIYDDVK